MNFFFFLSLILVSFVKKKKKKPIKRVLNHGPRSNNLHAQKSSLSLPLQIFYIKNMDLSENIIVKVIFFFDKVVKVIF